jgi:DNA polymerase-3 subunit epsilon
VIQIACIIEIDGEVVNTAEFKCQPYSFDNIQEKALAVHGYSVADLMTFPDPRQVKAELEGLFSKHVNKFDKKDKMTMAGYNVPFDYRFMREWWKKGGDKFFGSFFEYKSYDIYPLFQTYALAANLDLPNHKLVTACKHFGIEFDAHDALEDIRATRDLGVILKGIFEMGVLCTKRGYDPDLLGKTLLPASQLR